MGFVTHGCVDGYFRLIPYLKCETLCHVSVVLEHFVAATQKYGIPSRIRTDYGSENIRIELRMNLLRGYARGSHISGESVHNVRIERLWRDVVTRRPVRNTGLNPSTSEWKVSENSTSTQPF
ncbi:hypothetical protein HOLleu_42445 [Holothuria leucospilota]|uniref:Integrase core domain-containing protein n=1 Tax=Holothuria leucospilota TaxID=206669 RepID=A0A9Q0YD01_HOLLE|nr:hypothetical protein HOLleu_42445 [Holothuria leucospilota]